MDWVTHFNRVIDYIDENLRGEISYEEIARIAGCSVYNFQRMFSYIADKPLSEYIRHRRLTQAAFDLLNGEERIIDVALTYGYESQDAFTRAFKSFHGVLPSAVRAGTVRLNACPRFTFCVVAKGAENMKYQIEQWPAFTVAGVSTRLKTSSAFEIVPGLWENAWKDGTIQRFIDNYPDCRPAGFLGIAAHAEWGQAEEMDYILAVTTWVDCPECRHTPPPEGMNEYTYPSATWAIITADGPLPESVQNVYRQFYSEWLPSSGWKLSDLPVIECYMQENRQEVWIAIEKDN